MRYVLSRFKKENLDKTYRIYVTDSFKMIAENTARMSNGGKYWNLRYIDLIEDKTPEERTSEDVIADIRDKLHKLG